MSGPMWGLVARGPSGSQQEYGSGPGGNPTSRGGCVGARDESSCRGNASEGGGSGSSSAAAMAEAFRSGNLGIMDYYKMKNIESDTRMRESIADPLQDDEGNARRDG